MARRPDPWEKQDDETEPAWEAFVHYRDSGRERSIAKTVEHVGKSKRSRVHTWSSKHSWVVRASSWDNEVDRQHRLMLMDARRKTEERNLAIAGLAFQKAIEGLKAMDSSKLNARDIAALATTANTLERVALGAATTIHGVDSGPRVETGHVDVLTDEDRRARMLQLQREVNSRLGETG